MSPLPNWLWHNVPIAQFLSAVCLQEQQPAGVAAEFRERDVGDKIVAEAGGNFKGIIKIAARIQQRLEKNVIPRLRQVAPSRWQYFTAFPQFLCPGPQRSSFFPLFFPKQLD